MERLKKIGLSLSACLLILSFGIKDSNAQDAVKMLPGMHKVLLDNDDVRVYEATFKPGDKMPMHSHPKHVVYVLSGGTMTLTGKDGKKGRTCHEYRGCYGNAGRYSHGRKYR